MFTGRDVQRNPEIFHNKTIGVLSEYKECLGVYNIRECAYSGQIEKLSRIVGIVLWFVYIHVHIRIRTHRHTHTNTHTYTRTHTGITQTHTHTHTHTQRHNANIYTEIER